MTFNKTATAIIVASVFSLPITQVNAQATDTFTTDLTQAGTYKFNQGDKLYVYNINNQNTPSTFGDYLVFGEKFYDQTPPTTPNLTLNVTNSKLQLTQNIKLHSNLVYTDEGTTPQQIVAPDYNRPDPTKFTLSFANSTLTGDIINLYDGISGTNPSASYVVSAKGNDTSVSFDNASSWNGSLYQENKDKNSWDKDPYDKEADQIHNNKVTLDGGSSWTGSIKNSSQGTNTVLIYDETSTWNVNDTSHVNELNSKGKVNLTNHSLLIFNKSQQTSVLSNLNFSEGSQIKLNEGANVEVFNVTGQGHVHFNSLDNNSLKVEAADQPLNVVVDKLVNNKYGLNETLNKLDQQLTTGPNVQGTFKIEQSLIGDAASGSIVGDKLNVTNTVKNTNLVTTSELVAIQMMQWRAEADDMNQRMGELRDSTDANGLWVRTYGGKAEASMVDNEFVGFQFGYDHNVASGANQQFVGGAISYTKGDANYSTGTGDNDTFAFTGYSTWLLDNGSYVDFSAKYGKLNSDFDIKTVLGNLNGDYSTHGLAMGVEVGHRFPVANLFYVEPQVAFTASHIFGEDFGAGQGVTVEQDSINSYVARAGLAVGIKCPDNMGSVWMKASYLYDFDGETTTTAKNGVVTNQFAQDFGGGWYELGLGASMNFTKNLHGYADFEYASGAEIETPYKWNVGVRYTY